MRFACVWGAVLVTGCGVAVNVHPLNTPPGPPQPRDPGQVEVFTTGRPPYPYVEIAMLEARQESMYSQSSEGEVFVALRERAARLGCDGLMLLGSADAVQGYVQSTTNASGRVSSVSGGSRTLHGYRATCIVRSGGGGAPATPAVALAGDARREMVVASAEALVRTAPSEVAPELARLPRNYRLAATEDVRGPWRRVRLGDGRFGFAHDSDLANAPPRPADPAPPAAGLAPAAATVVTVPPTATPCEPPCSPGYGCEAGVCTALCNPPCAAGETCAGDRVCRRR